MSPWDVNAFAEWGRWCALRGDWTAAKDKWDAALRINSRSATVFNLRGGVLEGAGAKLEALSEYRQAAALRPRDPRTHIDVARLLDDSQKAQSEYKIALKLNAEDIVAAAKWNRWLATHGQWEAAEARWQAAQLASPRNVYTLAEWGDTLANANQAGAALEKFQAALAVNSSDAWIHLRIAWSLGNDERANGEYESAVRLDPRNVAALSAWGSWLASRNNMTGAETKWKAALQINPHSARVFSDWGDALEANRQYDLAFKKYEAAIVANPYDGTLKEKRNNVRKQRRR